MNLKKFKLLKKTEFVQNSNVSTDTTQCIIATVIRLAGISVL